jgi:hypothetical protein
MFLTTPEWCAYIFNAFSDAQPPGEEEPAPFSLVFRGGTLLITLTFIDIIDQLSFINRQLLSIMHYRSFKSIVKFAHGQR